MKLKAQRRIASVILKCSPKKVWIDSRRDEDIKEAITKRDIRGLIKESAIKKRKTNLQSRVRARKMQKQKSKGKRKGPGSRKGSINARVSKKERWMKRIRAQRSFLKELKQKKSITTRTFNDLYKKSKGGFFRSRRHITIYIDEHNLTK